MENVYIRYRPTNIKLFFGNVVEARTAWTKMERLRLGGSSKKQGIGPKP
jgi:hypothetical protein